MAARIDSQQMVAQSIARVQSAFDGNYGKYPIKEGDVSIGSITPLEDKIAITFRGSRDSLVELLTCTKVFSEALRHVNIQGHAHKGIHSSFQAIRKQVFQTVKQCMADNKIDHANLILEGHSRGTSLAALFAAYFKKKFPTSSITVLTYSPMAILDKTAAEQYTALIGEQNHLTFIAKEDPIPPIFVKLGFHHVGKKMEFSAENSPFYKKNVEENRFPYLTDNAVLSASVRILVGAKKWNAHMLETYRDVAPTLC